MVVSCPSGDGQMLNGPTSLRVVLGSVIEEDLCIITFPFGNESIQVMLGLIVLPGVSRCCSWPVVVGGERGAVAAGVYKRP